MSKTKTAASKIDNLRYGMVGYRPTGFYNSTFDEIKVRRDLGIETVYYDLVLLFDEIARVPNKSIKRDIALVKKLGKMGQATGKSLKASSRVYLALKDFVEKQKIDFLGVKCWPEMMKRGINPCMVLGRLTDEGIIAACESDFGGALSMLFGKWASKNASWLADIVDINDKNKSFYFWHCGAAPRSLAHEGEFPIINKQFRGLDRGNTLEFVLKEGDVTVLRFGITCDRYRIFAFEGKAVVPDKRIRGNVSQIIPENDPRQILDKIVEYGVEHHLVVVYGRHIKSFKELARAMKIDFYSA